MKRLLLLALLPCFAFAQGDAQEACSKLANVAGMVMEERQAGTDAVKMYEWAAGANPAIRDEMTDMVTDAYSQPRFSLTDYQQRAISEFKSTVMVQCMRGN